MIFAYNWQFHDTSIPQKGMFIMNKINQKIDKLKQKGFNSWIDLRTKRAQKKYGFEIGTGEYATWNNEADVVKN